jgi:hypothetical protein
MFPELWQSNRKSEEDRTAREEALEEAWATIPVIFRTGTPLPLIFPRFSMFVVAWELLE